MSAYYRNEDEAESLEFIAGQYKLRQDKKPNERKRIIGHFSSHETLRLPADYMKTK